MANIAAIKPINESELPASLRARLPFLRTLQAVRSTTLDKHTWFSTVDGKALEAAAYKYQDLTPMTLQELAMLFDNYTVGKYPGGPRTVAKAIESASRYIQHTQEAVQKVLDENPGCVQPYLTLECNSKGRIIGHILTGHRCRHTSVLLKAVILPKQDVTQISQAA